MKRALVVAALVASAPAAADPEAPTCSVSAGAYATLTYWEGAFRSRFPEGYRDSPSGMFMTRQATSVDEAHVERLELGGELRVCIHDQPSVEIRLGVEADRVGFNASRTPSGFDLELDAPITPAWRVGVRGAYLVYGLGSSGAKQVVVGARARYGFVVFDAAVLHEPAGNLYVPPGFDESAWGFFVGVGVDASSIGER